MKFSSAKIERLTGVPSDPQPNQFYLVEQPSTATLLYLSDSNSNLILLNGTFAGISGPVIPGNFASFLDDSTLVDTNTLNYDGGVFSITAPISVIDSATINFAQFTTEQLIGTTVTGDIFGVILGTNLSFTGTTLNAAGLTSGNAVGGGGPNRVLFENASQNLATDANFVFDGTNLGVGLASPSTRIHIKGLATNATRLFQTENSAGLQPFSIQNDGNVNIGATSNPSNNSRLYVFGGANGANLDVRGASGAFKDQAIIELEANDYDSTVKSCYLSFRGNTFTGTTMGFSNNYLGLLYFGGDTSIIATDSGKDLIFAPGFSEKGRWLSGGILKVGSVGYVSSPNSTSVFYGTQPNGSFSGGGNTILGVGAGANVTSAANNILVGAGAGGTATMTGTGQNVYIGLNTGMNTTTGNVNTGVGSQCLTALTTGVQNSVFGYAAGALLTTGANNVCIGAFSGGALVTGGNNVFIGLAAGAVYTQDSAVFIGISAGSSMVSGGNSVFIGSAAGSSNNSAGYVTFVGASAGQNATGSEVVMIGAQAGVSSTANVVVCIGRLAGYQSTGTGGVYVGYQAGLSCTGANNVCLGTNAGYSETGSNKLYIDNANNSNPFLYGEFDNLKLYTSARDWRQRYDTSNYFKQTIDANANVTCDLIAASGTPVFTFSKSIVTSGAISVGTDINTAEGTIVQAGTSTGLKIGSTTSQKLGFWNTAPIVQPTTGVAAASFTANSGTTVNDASTFDGYTLPQIVKALRNIGLLA